MVSGSFHTLLRESFHLLLALLVHYRSGGVFSLGSEFSRIHDTHPSATTLEQSYYTHITVTGLSPSLAIRSRILHLLVVLFN